MVYAYDQWALLPVRDLYDTLMMLASINAAKDMYEKGAQEIKEFKKEYGDFLSPIQKDMDWYSENVTGRVRRTINDLYAAGIDPLRSAEGRAAISRMINDMDTGLINKMRQSAQTRKLYDEAAIKMGPKYDKNFANWDFARRHGGVTPEQWSTSENGVFTDPTPVEFSTLQELVHPSFSAIKPHMLSQAEVESRGYKYDPNYDYTGIVRGDMEKVMDRLIPGVRGDARFMYHRELAKRDLINEHASMGDTGYVPSEEEIDKRLVDNAITSDAQIMTPLEYTPNKFALIKAEGDQQIRAAYARAAASGGGGGRGRRDENVPSIFRESYAMLPRKANGPSTDIRSIGNIRRGDIVGYDVMEDPHYQWIDPVGDGIRLVKSKKGGNYAYFIPKRTLKNIYRYDEYNNDGSKVNSQYDVFGDTYFQPSGQMHAETDAEGNVRYYISGQLMSGSGANAMPIQENGFAGGSRLYELEVTERAFNYGKKQASTYSPDN